MALRDELIPNNVDLAGDARLRRALESWHPKYMEWWQERGPRDFQDKDIYLRTAVSVEPGGWAHFDYVKMPEYRWGIFLAPKERDEIHFGDHIGRQTWDKVPGEFRKDLRRLIVTQADTEPASVEQQQMLGHCAPSLYDLRNLFQVNVEEGRHLWAMVYLLHQHFGRDGREEAEDLLLRRSGDADTPRILNAFNEPIVDWLDFFCFTMFTDRDGKFQLGALAESAFTPLSQSTRFMLSEEAHHLFVGDTGVGRTIRRTVQLEKENDDVTQLGGIPFAVIQKYVNHWFSLSIDLFGSEDSSNSATFFAQGLKGRFYESDRDKHPDPVCLEGSYTYETVDDEGRLVTEEVAMRRALNAVLKDSYVEDCQISVKRWNKMLEEEGSSHRIRLPSQRFNRAMGVWEGIHFDTDGNPLSTAEWEARKADWLPTAEDRAYVKSLMQPVTEPGKFANWIAAPRRGINKQSVDFEYVRL